MLREFISKLCASYQQMRKKERDRKVNQRVNWWRPIGCTFLASSTLSWVEEMVQLAAENEAHHAAIAPLWMIACAQQQHKDELKDIQVEFNSKWQFGRRKTRLSKTVKLFSSSRCWRKTLRSSPESKEEETKKQNLFLIGRSSTIFKLD